MTDTLIAIPARYGSTRLKAKALLDLEGKSILQRVWEKCREANIGEVIIATDSQIIIDHCASFGANAVMTSEACQSGTDRIYEACKNRNEKYIINVQGDEPFIKPDTVRRIAEVLKTDAKADISTACIATTDEKIVNNPNCVKAVLTADMKALYFSRAAVPFKRDLTDDVRAAPYYHHCGIYGYKKASLEKFVNLPQSPLERLEKLEQLRALEAGMLIKSIIIERTGPAIDTAEDLEAAKQYIRNAK